jgi:hypothetical protein
MGKGRIHAILQIKILIVLLAISGCTSIHPLEPGSLVYPPGDNKRYDMVPPDSRFVGIPVTGLRGDPHQLRIRILDDFNQALEFDSEVIPTAKDGYLLYKLGKLDLADQYKKAKITNPPAHVTIEITDKPDPSESFIIRWLRLWGRSDSKKYFIRN